MADLEAARDKRIATGADYRRARHQAQEEEREGDPNEIKKIIIYLKIML